MTDTTVTIEAPLPNSPEARTPEGTLKDQASTTTSIPTEPTEPKPTEGEAPKPVEGGAPEAYADFTLPEGIKLEGDQLKSATELFKSLNLPQAEAQKLVDYHTAQLKAASDAPMAEYNATREKWKADTQAELGSQLPKIKENVGKAFAALNDPALVTSFKSIMDVSGVGDNPAFIKVMNKLAERFIEGTHVAGAQPSKFGQAAPGTSDKPSTAKALYPNNP